MSRGSASHSYEQDPIQRLPAHLQPLPAGHGPPGIRLGDLSVLKWAPTFVKGQQEYDDLGRRVEAARSEGVRKENMSESGFSNAAEFWRNLYLTSKSSSGNGAAMDPQHARIDALSSERGPASTSSGPGPTCRASGKRDRKRSASPEKRELGGLQTKRSETSLSLAQSVKGDVRLIKEPPNSTPLLIPRSQWFIRRALLSKDHRRLSQSTERNLPRASGPSSAAGEGASSSSGVHASVSAPITRSGSVEQAMDRLKPTRPSTSISCLLSDLPSPGQLDGQTQAFVPPAYFYLGRENKGFRVLEKIGWDGQTGLGSTGSSSSRIATSDRQISHSMKVEDGVRQGEVNREINQIANDVIDLTGHDDSDSDGDSNIKVGPSPKLSSTGIERFGDEYLRPTSAQGGDSQDSRGTPSSDGRNVGGRLAPIPTVLKTDMSGIGHRPQSSYSSLRPAKTRSNTTTSSFSSPPASRKRITHSEAELRAIKRGKVLDSEQQEKREKKKAKKQAKRDREDRLRWRQIIGT